VAPEAWSWVVLGGREAVAVRRARALSDEGDDPGLTDRLGPPVSESEATAELDKRSRQRPKWTSRAGNGRIGQAAESDKHPGLNDRVGPPISKRETMAEMDKRRSWAAAGLENKGGGRAENKEKGISELKLDF
jgi:hypothetical protein